MSKTEVVFLGGRLFCTNPELLKKILKADWLEKIRPRQERSSF